MRIVLHHSVEAVATFGLPPEFVREESDSTIPSEQWNPSLSRDIAERLIMRTPCEMGHTMVEFFDGEVLYNSYTREDFE